MGGDFLKGSKKVTIRSIIDESLDNNELERMDASIESWFVDEVIPAVRKAILYNNKVCHVNIPGVFHHAQLDDIYSGTITYYDFFNRYVKRIEEEDLRHEFLYWPVKHEYCCTNPQPNGTGFCELCKQPWRDLAKKPTIRIIWD
jgi:broad specificity polyphosphatase/5'/3'-nucleotidase SurE